MKYIVNKAAAGTLPLRFQQHLGPSEVSRPGWISTSSDRMAGTTHLPCPPIESLQPPSCYQTLTLRFDWTWSRLLAPPWSANLLESEKNPKCTADAIWLAAACKRLTFGSYAPAMCVSFGLTVEAEVSKLIFLTHKFWNEMCEIAQDYKFEQPWCVNNMRFLISPSTKAAAPANNQYCAFHSCASSYARGNNK